MTICHFKQSLLQYFCTPSAISCCYDTQTMLILLLIIPSMVFWYMFYNSLRKVYVDQSPEFSNRLVTLCHGTFMAVFGGSQCFLHGWAFNNCDEPTSLVQSTVLFASLGYFSFDLGWCLYYKSETNLMIVHHIYSCFAMTRMLLKDILANQATCALGLMEMTNPLLQLRWFLRTLGYQQTILFTLVECCFLFVFIGMRVILGTVITVQVLIGKQDLEFKMLAIVIYGVSWGFMINMYMFIRKKYSEKMSGTELHSPLSDLEGRISTGTI